MKQSMIKCNTTIVRMNDTEVQEFMKQVTCQNHYLYRFTSTINHERPLWILSEDMIDIDVMSNLGIDRVEVHENFI